MAARPDAEVRWGLVADTITFFEHAVVLARGVTAEEQAAINAEPDIRRRLERLRRLESRTVPRADMEAAHAIAREVRRLYVEWQNQYFMVRWPATVEINVRAVMNAAADATKHLMDETRQILDGSRPGVVQVRSLLGAWPLIWIQWLNAAYEPLQIIEGELALADSAVGRAAEVYRDIADFVASTVPLVGEFVLSYEAGIGYQFVGGRKLTTTERVLAVVALAIPPALGALVKAAPRVGIALRNFKVNLARLIPKAAAERIERFSADMIIGLRALPRESFDKFLRLLATRGPLTATQAAEIQFFMSRIDYVSRLAQWMRIIEKRLGKGFNGLHELPRPLQNPMKPHEPEMIEKLHKLTGKRVIVLPEMVPGDYEALAAKLLSKPRTPIPHQVDGVKFADIIWGEEFAELYQVSGNSTERILKAISSKGKQASTLVISRAPESKLDLVALIDERFWARPENGYVDKVVLLLDQGLRIIERPVAHFSLNSKTYAMLRAIIGNPGVLVRIVEDVLKAQEEADPDRAKPKEPA
ncbi:pre-toxin TG domain-containing protein, partial [Actinomadura rubrisoli]